MKNLFIYITFVFLFVSGCASKPESEMPPEQKFSRVEVQIPVSTEDIRIVEAKTQVTRGNYGSITIQGQVGQNYSITATYRNGQKILTATQTGIADSNGQVAWTWFVSPDTAVGTYPITISGGGKSLVTSYTVTQ